MIVVTGAAGFIGANLVKGLNNAGHTDILAVDDLTQADKIRNLADCVVADYMDKDEFREKTEIRGQVVENLTNGANISTADGQFFFFFEIVMDIKRTLL